MIKLSITSAPHGRPGELGMWGPLDEFLILNARRPVDFYTPVPLPSLGSVSKHSPENLPGCTNWREELVMMMVGVSRLSSFIPFFIHPKITYSKNVLSRDNVWKGADIETQWKKKLE